MSPLLKLIFSLLCLFFFCCGNEKTQPDLPDLSVVDSISITYKSDFDSSGKMNLKTVHVKDQSEIASLKNVISKNPFPYPYCISSGSMIFYERNTALITIVFNTSDDYRHIAYNRDNKLISLELSEENARLIEKFYQMKN